MRADALLRVKNAQKMVSILLAIQQKVAATPVP